MIGSDDELEIIVWTQPQLSGKVIVASDGTIAMPLIGRVPAAGLTPDQLKADLEKRYARYVHGANATVRVSDPASHVFYVLGQVNKPGVYKLHSGEVLSQALAEAGGLGEFADAGKIRILRRKENETVVLTVNYNVVRSGGDLSADVPVEPGDTVSSAMIMRTRNHTGILLLAACIIFAAPAAARADNLFRFYPEAAGKRILFRQCPAADLQRGRAISQA